MYDYFGSDFLQMQQTIFTPAVTLTTVLMILATLRLLVILVAILVSRTVRSGGWGRGIGEGVLGVWG